MTKSALQIARAAYQPKLPKALTGAVMVKEGEPTQSVADQEAIQKLFPNTYGMPLIQFVEGESKEYAPMNVGVILSGGQAPGGHNVISGLFDGIPGPGGTDGRPTGENPPGTGARLFDPRDCRGRFEQRKRIWRYAGFYGGAERGCECHFKVWQSKRFRRVFA